MEFISTTGAGPKMSFKDAVLSNLPADGGLFFPTAIPQIDQELMESIGSMHLSEIAVKVLLPYCGADVDQQSLNGITKRVFDFPVPVKAVGHGIHSLELFHGPTFAFKDVGAKFLAECLAHFSSDKSKKITVLVATSGDTGGAVANGFLGVEGVRVIILYPKGKVSALQEKQLTTLGQNITALEVSGTFDDCQNMVKAAFNDAMVNEKLRLSSANSINVARWLPQSLFYFVPFQQGFKDIVMSVPSGNYGNLTSGILAMKMGVPIAQFIAASNANDVVPRYLRSGDYLPQSTIPTVANAMDVSDPSNFKRLLSFFRSDFESIKHLILPFSMEDGAIRQTIKTCKEENDYLLDPHSAIGYEALRSKGLEGVFLSTAHYCKFLPIMHEALGEEVAVPDFAKDLMDKQKESILMEANYDHFKEYLLS